MSQLLIIRHGKASEHLTLSQKIFLSDEKRPLTEEGKSQIKEIAKSLSKLVRPTHFISSRFKRAVQTMEILAQEYGVEEFEQWKELCPSCHPVEFLEEWGQRHNGSDEILAVAGHEPHLSTLISFLLSGESRSFVKMKKGGAALLEFSNGIQPGSARLLWHLTPDLLRKFT